MHNPAPLISIAPPPSREDGGKPRAAERGKGLEAGCGGRRSVLGAVGYGGGLREPGAGLWGAEGAGASLSVPWGHAHGFWGAGRAQSRALGCWGRGWSIALGCWECVEQGFGILWGAKVEPSVMWGHTDRFFGAAGRLGAGFGGLGGHSAWLSVL